VFSSSFRAVLFCGTHGEERNLYKVLVEKPKERGHSEDRGVNGRMESEWILGNVDGGWSGFSWLRIGTGGGLL
jgi:hypothetical protein